MAVIMNSSHIINGRWNSYATMTAGWYISNKSIWHEVKTIYWLNKESILRFHCSLLLHTKKEKNTEFLTYLYLYTLPSPPSQGTNPCDLSTTAYSVYFAATHHSQLQDVPRWWQGANLVWYMIKSAWINNFAGIPLTSNVSIM